MSVCPVLQQLVVQLPEVKPSEGWQAVEPRLGLEDSEVVGARLEPGEQIAERLVEEGSEPSEPELAGLELVVVEPEELGLADFEAENSQDEGPGLGPEDSEQEHYLMVGSPKRVACLLRHSLVV